MNNEHISVSFPSWFVNISQKYVVLGWTVGSLLLMSMIFGPTKKELSRTAALFYTAMGKTAWSLGIAWFIVACACGRGGIVNRVLSAKCLLPYSRMSYTAYLINPLCIMYGVMMCEAPIHLDFLTLVSIELRMRWCGLTKKGPIFWLFFSSSADQQHGFWSYCIHTFVFIHANIWESIYSSGKIVAGEIIVKQNKIFKKKSRTCKVIKRENSEYK